MHRSGKKRIALIGFGCVGEGVYQLLQKESSSYEVSRIVVKAKRKKRNAPKHLFQFNFEEVFNRRKTNVVIELIDDAEVALEVCEKAIKSGIPFISANKKMIAENLGLINEWRATFQTPVFYEASVCAEIPVLRELNQWREKYSISSISGVFNGTSNYILSQMTQFGIGYQSALSKAQEKGFAESDPSSDVKGIDSLYKATILSSFIHSQNVDLNQSFATGIENISSADINFAKEQGLKIKLLATILSKENGVDYFVAPALVSESNSAWGVENEWNVVEIKTEMERKILIGKGAGSIPTAKAVFQNLNDVFQKHRPYPLLQNDFKLGSKDSRLDVVFRAPRSAEARLINSFEVVGVQNLGDDVLLNAKISSKQLKKFKGSSLNDDILVFLNVDRVVKLENMKSYQYARN